MVGQFSHIDTYCGLCIISLLAISSGQFLFSEHESFRKTCDNTATFKQIFHVTLSECADECFRRQRCKTIMYRDILDFCALKDDVNIAGLDNKGALCRFNHIDNVLLENEYLGPCSNHTCGANERCTDVSKNETEYECVKSECEPPRTIANAYLLSHTHVIGTTNRYRCGAGYAGRGNPTITCDAEAQWTSTDFYCARLCPAPKANYYNGDLTNVEGEDMGTGTVLHFTCRYGYRSIGEIATSVCHHNGHWSPDRIRCCHNNSTNFVNGVCMKPIGVGNASNINDVHAHCGALGGYWQWVSGSIRNKIRKEENVTRILQKRYKTWYMDRWNFTACAIANIEELNETVITDAKEGNEGTEQTLDETVTEVENTGQEQPAGDAVDETVVSDTDEVDGDTEEPSDNVLDETVVDGDAHLANGDTTQPTGDTIENAVTTATNEAYEDTTEPTGETVDNAVITAAVEENSVTESNVATLSNETVCDDVYGEDGEEEYHFDDMVKEAVCKDWSSNECSVAHIWMPGEPNGGDIENCLFLDPDVLQYYDGNCEFDRDSVGFACGFAIPRI